MGFAPDCHRVQRCASFCAYRYRNCGYGANSGLLPQVRETLVVPDLDGKRIGSGGSTLILPEAGAGPE